LGFLNHCGGAVKGKKIFFYLFFFCAFFCSVGVCHKQMDDQHLAHIPELVEQITQTYTGPEFLKEQEQLFEKYASQEFLESVLEPDKKRIQAIKNVASYYQSFFYTHQDNNFVETFTFVFYYVIVVAK